MTTTPDTSGERAAGTRRATRGMGVIGVKDGWSSQQLAGAFEKRLGACHLLELEHAAADLSAGTAVCDGVDLCGLDALVVKKIGRAYSPHVLDRLEILRFVESRGVRVFSSPAAIARLIDRLSCTVALRMHEIPMPATTVTEDVSAAAAAVERYGRAILKPLFTSKARGMQVVEAGDDTRPEQLAEFQAAGNPVMYVQQLVEHPGRDLGLVFLGGEYVGCYARVADRSAWNTTTRSGGKYRAHEPDDALVALAKRAQSPFGMDFTCVDIVETEDGPLVFEVSAFGGFRGLREARGIDAAGLYADYVLGRLRG